MICNNNNVPCIHIHATPHAVSQPCHLSFSKCFGRHERVDANIYMHCNHNNILFDHVMFITTCYFIPKQCTDNDNTRIHYLLAEGNKVDVVCVPLHPSALATCCYCYCYGLSSSPSPSSSSSSSSPPSSSISLHSSPSSSAN